MKKTNIYFQLIFIKPFFSHLMNICVSDERICAHKSLKSIFLTIKTLMHNNIVVSNNVSINIFEMSLIEKVSI